MSEEEKKAIEQLKSWREYIVNHRDSVNKANDLEFYLRTALNLIEKQQKEIEERNTRLQEEINENCKLKTELYGNSISKDKIREKIKEIEWVEEIYKCQCDSCRDIRDEGRYMAYKELLEE